VTVYGFEQKSPEWFSVRAGRLTGSAAADMLASVKTKGEAASRRDLRLRLVVERLTGIPQDDGTGYVNAAMQRGIDKEADAIAAYEAATGLLVRRTGFLAHDDLMAGCSLDGDVDDFTGIVEVKCPKSSTHLATYKSREVPPCHMPQIVHNCWISGATWCDFVSFDDRLPVELSLFHTRVFAPDVAAYELMARQFLSECDAEFESINALRQQKREAA
jgi:hypothetical protein